jgi:hypothetical protein
VLFNETLGHVRCYTQYRSAKSAYFFHYVQSLCVDMNYVRSGQNGTREQQGVGAEVQHKCERYKSISEIVMWASDGANEWHV